MPDRGEALGSRTPEGALNQAGSESNWHSNRLTRKEPLLNCERNILSLLDIASTRCIVGNMNSDLESLGALLRESRERLGLTLREVEAKTEISNAYLSQIEGAKIKQPSPQVLHKLCSLYECSYAVVMEMAGYPLPSAGKAP